jgi:hypothetical protein
MVQHWSKIVDFVRSKGYLEVFLVNSQLLPQTTFLFNSNHGSLESRVLIFNSIFIFKFDQESW